MDSLKTLIDQKKYDLVIKLTETSESANDLFYRISAFMLFGKYEDALYVIQDHQKILESNLVSLINAHINLLCALSRFDQAYSVLDYYANLPYQSQIVEELLAKMPKVIEAEEKKQNSIKYFDDESISNLLKSNNDEEVLMALDIIKNRDVFSFLEEIKGVMLNYPRETVKSYALMLLAKKEVDRNLQINKNGKLIDVNPKNLVPPFSGAIFNEVIRYFDYKIKDQTISQTATQLLSQYCIYIYPDILTANSKLYSVAFYVIACRYAGAPLENQEFDQLIEQEGLLKEELDELINAIEKVLSDF